MGEFATTYGIVPAGADGVAVYHESRNTADYSKRKWEVTVLDSILNYKWGAAFESDLGFEISDATYHSGYLYLMFLDANIPVKQVFFARLNMDNGQISFFEINQFLPRNLFGFEVIGESIFLIGSDNQKPAILKYTFGDPRPKVLEGLFEEKIEILNISVDEDHHYIQIVSKISNKGIGSAILIKQFDENGHIIQDIFLESSKERRLLNAVVASDGDGRTAISGVFSYGNAKFSNGVFTAVFTNGEPIRLYYYDYVNFRNIFNYLESPDKAERVQEKYKNKRDGRSLKIKHEPRQIILQHGEWRFVGEVVQASTKYVGPFHNDYYISNYAIAYGIDQDGKIKWDNTFSLNQKLSLNSRQQTFINSLGDDVMMFYSDNYGVHYKIMQGNDDLIPHNLYQINQQNNNLSEGETEQVVIESPETEQGLSPGLNLLDWYENAYLRFGIVNWSLHNSPQKSFVIDKIRVSSNPTQ